MQGRKKNKGETYKVQEQEARAGKPQTICCLSLKINKQPLDTGS